MGERGGRGDPAAQGDRLATLAAYEEEAARYVSGVPPLPLSMERLLDEFAALTGSPARVLEIGSASGRDADALEARGLSVRRTDITRAFVDGLRAVGHDADRIDPLHDPLGGPYDGVYTSATLLHLGRDEFSVVAHRLREVTRAGGALCLTLKEGDGEGWSSHGRITAPRHFTYWRAGPVEVALRRPAGRSATCGSSRVGSSWRSPGCWCSPPPAEHLRTPAPEPGQAARASSMLAA